MTSIFNPRHAENRQKYEGSVFPTRSSGDIIVVEYRDSKNVLVKFLDTGFESVVFLSCVLNGNIKDKMKPTIYGIGVCGDERVTNSFGRKVKEYRFWSSMIQRCYDPKLKVAFPSYEGCTTSENFKYYPYFKDWCNNQVGFNSIDSKGKDFALDKDILVKGNKIYSEGTCCFVPYEINNLLSSSKATRGSSPIGVSFHKRDHKYQAYLNTGTSRVHLGYFVTSEEAFEVYKQAKETHIKEVANKWKDQIDPRAYEALMNYQVEITD